MTEKELLGSEKAALGSSLWARFYGEQVLRLELCKYVDTYRKRLEGNTHTNENDCAR